MQPFRFAALPARSARYGRSIQNGVLGMGAQMDKFGHQMVGI